MARKQTKRNTYKSRGTLQRSPLYTLQARATKKRNESMHKAGALVLLTVAVVAAVWLAITGFGKMNRWLFADNDRFTVRHLDVSSSGRLSEAHIKEFANIDKGVNLFDLDIESMRESLESGPLIKSVEIQRKLPDTLVVRVNERIPLARIAHGKSKFYFSIDRDGHVLGLAGPKLKNMPIIRGHGDKGLTPGDALNDGGAIDALSVIGMCDDGTISQVVSISSIDVSFPEFLDVLMEDKRRVWLPRNPSRSKILDMVRVLQEADASKTFFDLTIDRNIPAT